MEVFERCDECRTMFVVEGNPLIGGLILCDDCERVGFYEEREAYA